MIYEEFCCSGFAAAPVVIPGDPKIGDLAPTPTGLPATAHIKANASHLIRYVLFVPHIYAGNLICAGQQAILLAG